MGGLTKHLQELRIQLSQTAGGSAGARDFVLSTYQALKKANPEFPILVRESARAQPRLVARYGYGVEESVVVENMDKAAIESELQKLVKKGESMAKT